MSKVKHEKGEFQLEFPDGTPGVVKMAAGSALKWVNDFDGNNDGISDVAQYGPKVQKHAPAVIEIIMMIDWRKAVSWVLRNFAKDPAAAEAKIAAIESDIKVA